MEQAKTIYFAADLFDAGAQFRNSIMATELERQGFEVLLPQRDGFEFSKLHQRLEASNVPNPDDAIKDIIYLLDVYHFIPNSDLILAILDGQQLDEGVVHEMLVASVINIPVISVRTDVRTPYGDGPHIFPYWPNNFHMLANISSKPEQLATAVTTLIREKFGASPRNALADISARFNAISNPVFHRRFQIAQQLFEGIHIKKINREEGMARIVERYKKMQAQIKDIRCNIIDNIG